jgi:hypothetical protein
MDEEQKYIHRSAAALAIFRARYTADLESRERRLCGRVWRYLSQRGSLRSAAKDLGFSPAYLSDVSHGKRNVSAELLKRVLSL